MASYQYYRMRVSVVVLSIVVVVLDSEQQEGEKEGGREEEREIGFVYPALEVFSAGLD